ncbi:MAG: hypothetical protein ACOCXT_00705 [Candidatus Dojkabacteria bacterium]
MVEKNIQNHIYTYTFQSNLPDGQSFSSLGFTSSDKYEVFITATLSSRKIKDLNTYLSAGIQEVQSRFNAIDLPTLDRMKSAIFQSGDFLANKLLNAKEAVDDVDFSVCIVAIKDKALYVWIDGDLNIRMYRGTDSIIVNDSGKPQFFGSSVIELGDILCIAGNEHVKEQDHNAEQYVLEQDTPRYPAFYLDYQLDQNEAPNTDEAPLESKNNATIAPAYQEEEYGYPAKDHDSSRAPKVPAEKAKQALEGIKANVSDQFQKLKKSGIGNKILESTQKILTGVWGVIMRATSGILDFIYVNVFRKNQHQLRRFQSSPQKKNLQYLLIAVLIISSFYVFFLRDTGSQGSETEASNTDSTSENENFRAAISEQFDVVESAYKTSQFSEFSNALASLETKISEARQADFSDETFLNETLDKAQNYEDTLFKVTRINKATGFNSASEIQGADIVDFSVVGSTIYALDRSNSQVLKSNSSLGFDVFAGTSDLTAMSRMVCSSTECYIIDDEKGLALLSISDKKFTTYSQSLGSAGIGVVEMGYYAPASSIYTFVPSEGKINKYSKSGQQFSNPVQWNKTAGSFGMDTVDITIDGGIIEILKDGTVNRYFSGTKESEPAGIEPATPSLGQDVQISTTPARNPSPNNKDRLYIADSDNDRIAVYDKTPNSNDKYSFLGNYKYGGPEAITFSDFAQIILSEDEKLLYVLEDNTVYALRVDTL